MSGITSNMQDEDIVAQYVKTQKQEYFAYLFDKYAPKVQAKCLSFLKDREKAEDATQDIFIKIVLNISKYNGRAKFSTWIYSITYNFCIDQIRKEKKLRTTSMDDVHHIGTSDDQEISDAEILEIRVERLKAVLAEIADADRTILLMKYQEEMSIKDISDLLDISESAVKMRLKRAKSRLVKLHDELYND